MYNIVRCGRVVVASAECTYERTHATTLWTKTTNCQFLTLVKIKMLIFLGRRLTTPVYVRVDCIWSDSSLCLVAPNAYHITVTPGSKNITTLLKWQHTRHDAIRHQNHGHEFWRNKIYFHCSFKHIWSLVSYVYAIFLMQICENFHFLHMKFLFVCVIIYYLYKY